MCCLHKCISFVFFLFIWPFNVKRIIQWYGLAGRNDEQKNNVAWILRRILDCSDSERQNRAKCWMWISFPLVDSNRVRSFSSPPVYPHRLLEFGRWMWTVSLGVHVCDSSVVLPINSITRILPQSGYCELVNCKHISTKWVCIGFLLLLNLSWSQSKNCAYLRRRNI